MTRFWPAYWITLRPYLFFVSGASGLVGLALAGGMPWLPFAAALTAFLLAYGLGQAVTDVFQTDTDALSAPYRPLVRGDIGRAPVLAVSLAGLLLCGVTLFALNTWTAPLTAAAVVGLLTYTPAKRRFWAGPAWNSWIVALLPAVGLLCGKDALGALGSRHLAWAVASVFFSYAVFVLLGYLKDVEADRRTGYDTLPVRFGRTPTVAVSAACAAASAASSAALVAGSTPFATIGGALGLAGWLGAIVLLARAHLLALAVTRDADAHPAIALSVRGYVALHLAESALLRPTLAVLALALYVAFDFILRRRPCASQI